MKIKSLLKVVLPVVLLTGLVSVQAYAGEFDFSEVQILESQEEIITGEYNILPEESEDWETQTVEMIQEEDFEENDFSELFIEEESIAAEAEKEHVFGEWTIVVPATCTATGKKERVCSLCGAKEEEVIPEKLHVAGSAKKENVIPATVESDGSYDEVIYCKECNKELSRKKVTVGKIVIENAPKLISALNTPDGIQVKWEKIDGVKRYRVFRKSGKSGWKKLQDVTSTSVIDYSAEAGSVYSYTVRCLSSDGKRYISPYDTTGKTCIFVEVPAIPSLSLQTNGVKISWKAAKGASSYRVYRKTGTENWRRICESTALSYVDNKIVSGTTYSYTIVGVAANENEKYTSSYNSKGSSVTYVAAPAVPTYSMETGGVKVIWKAVTGAEKYRLFRKTGNGSWKKVVDTTGISYIDKGLKSGTKYTYTVRCLSADGKKYTSLFNSRGSDYTYIEAPVMTYVGTHDGFINIDWEPVKGAECYRLFRKVNNGSWTKVTDTDDTVFVDKDVKNGVKYTYTVRCISADKKRYTSVCDSARKSVIYLIVPENVSVLNSGNRQMTVKWSANERATGYQIYYPTRTKKYTTTVSGAQTVSVVLDHLNANDTYAVYVRAYKKVNGVYYYSEWSVPITIEIK